MPSIRKTGNYSVNADYNNKNINDLKSELERKKLILANLKVDRQLEQFTKKPQGNSEFSDIRLDKIYRLVRRKQEITAQDVKRFIWEFKTTPTNEINVLLLELIKLGKAQQIATKKGLKIQIL